MKKMLIHYDKKGDCLEIIFGKPTPAYYDDAGDDLFVRRDEKTGKIAGYTIFNLQKRRQIKDFIVKLPIHA